MDGGFGSLLPKLIQIEIDTPKWRPHHTAYWRGRHDILAVDGNVEVNQEAQRRHFHRTACPEMEYNQAFVRPISVSMRLRSTVARVRAFKA